MNVFQWPMNQPVKMIFKGKGQPADDGRGGTRETYLVEIEGEDRLIWHGKTLQRIFDFKQAGDHVTITKERVTSSQGQPINVFNEGTGSSLPKEPRTEQPVTSQPPSSDEGGSLYQDIKNSETEKSIKLLAILKGAFATDGSFNPDGASAALKWYEEQMKGVEEQAKEMATGPSEEINETDIPF